MPRFSANIRNYVKVVCHYACRTVFQLPVGDRFDEEIDEKCPFLREFQKY
ncbi:MAG: hypothetical protein ACTSXJ_06295 [Candidatus Baldrarchaeia archaeon]